MSNCASPVAKHKKQWTAFAYDCEPGKDGRGRYRHIGHRHYVKLHGLDDPIVAVTLTEDSQGDYWGWLASDAAEPSMVWPSKVQFTMCFPYGPEAEVKRGKGKILRLRVERRSVGNATS